MKFQKGDTVKIVANRKRLECIGIYNQLFHGLRGKVILITDNLPIPYYVRFTNGDYYFSEQDLELVEQEQRMFIGHPNGQLEVVNKSEIRTFETGATRDTLESKLSYVKALSPIVLQRYVQYLDNHREQPDGSMRDFDNWKKGIDVEAYFDGLGRHFVAIWLLQQGFDAEDNHGSVTLEDSLCAVIFNAMGWLHELLKADVQPFVIPEGWVIKFNDFNGCGWYINYKESGYLWKDQSIHQISTGYIKFIKKHKREPRCGEVPGYWPTEEAAKDALKQYLDGEMRCGNGKIK